MTLVDNKSKKEDAVKKAGELVSLLWFQVFQKDYKYKKSKNSYKCVIC